ncbi:hypothetical protein EW145_g2261 [Phellinidium pouzarii]|uniref:Uncharacterized protein n=1 Tax=Phellinidium pouzarii TaxID=167371 RepID=A0A4S4LDA1_9AGAM|nr:hypothetical protein EW145_g2261 [Phellinidium pouzarii]
MGQLTMRQLYREENSIPGKGAFQHHKTTSPKFSVEKEVSTTTSTSCNEINVASDSTTIAHGISTVGSTSQIVHDGQSLQAPVSDASIESPISELTLSFPGLTSTELSGSVHADLHQAPLSYVSGSYYMQGEAFCNKVPPLHPENVPIQHYWRRQSFVDSTSNLNYQSRIDLHMPFVESRETASQVDTPSSNNNCLEYYQYFRGNDGTPAASQMNNNPLENRSQRFLSREMIVQTIILQSKVCQKGGQKCTGGPPETCSRCQEKGRPCLPGTPRKRKGGSAYNDGDPFIHENPAKRLTIAEEHSGQIISRPAASVQGSRIQTASISSTSAPAPTSTISLSHTNVIGMDICASPIMDQGFSHGPISTTVASRNIVQNVQSTQIHSQAIDICGTHGEGHVGNYGQFKQTFAPQAQMENARVDAHFDIRTNSGSHNAEFLQQRTTSRIDSDDPMSFLDWDAFELDHQGTNRSEEPDCFEDHYSGSMFSNDGLDHIEDVGRHGGLYSAAVLNGSH